MIHSIFALSGTDAAPYLIRIAAVIVAILSVFDFLRRRAAVRFIESLRDAGADSPQNAVSLTALEKARRHITLEHRLLLGNGASLGEAVASVMPDGKAQLGGVGRELSWYVPADHADGDGDGAQLKRVPNVLRRGGGENPWLLALGVVLIFAAAELLIRFFPQIVTMLTYVPDRIG